MDKRKPRENNDAMASAVDELAVTKSAAWAWYERGSGSDGRSIREFEVWRAKTEPKPSRYKLEAMRNFVQQKNTPIASTTSSSPKSSITSRASILLDKYEIQRISKQLDYYIEASHAKYSGEKEAAAEEERTSEVTSLKSGQKKKSSKGFSFRHGTICGSSRNDVVRNSSVTLDCNSRRLPLKPGRVVVVVVEGFGCRPRSGIRV